ncbi:MAG: BMP family ABC transporter substrate-binding protein [Bacilli bacterium]|nr:BMP family ABC transporter substrate-binding protein [Bacilli bacterium]
MKNKQIKSFLAALSLGVLAATAASCGAEKGLGPVAKEDIKIGFIYIGDPSTSTYDKNFKNAITGAMKELGLKDNQLFEKTGVSDSDASAYTAAVDLIDSKGCNVIIADSFGHEAHVIRAAKENKSVRFYHASGTKAHTEKLDNFSNAFASIYEGRYLAGVAAGMKLNELGGAHKLGYVGAYNFAEVISGYTAYYLGAKSVCDDVTMDVRYTSSWGDEVKESAAATALINGGAQVISQHADTYGAPAACKEKGVPNISYNVAAEEGYENTFLSYSRIDWTEYFKTVINSAVNNEKVPYDHVGTLANGGVVSDKIGKCAAEGTAEAVATAAAAIKDGSLKIFDTSKFTVSADKNPYGKFTVDADGHLLTAYANVDDTDEEYSKETQVVENGVYEESAKRSAPYFDLIIDGITEVK